MALLENNTPEIIASVQEVLTEHHDLSEAFDAEVILIQAEFKQKYRECVAGELAQLDEEEGGSIQDFTSKINVLKLEQTKTIGELRKKQAKMSTDLKSKLGEFDDVGKRNVALIATLREELRVEKVTHTCDKKDMGKNIQAIITALQPVANSNYQPQQSRPIATAQIAALTQLKANYALN